MDYKALEWSRALKVPVAGSGPCIRFADIKPPVQQRVRVTHKTRAQQCLHTGCRGRESSRETRDKAMEIRVKTEKEIKREVCT